MGLSTVSVDLHDDIDLKEVLVDEETRAEFSLTERHIRIQGDDELLQAGSFFQWPGEGTREDPIIIADHHFDGDNRRPAFRLDNTSLHLILKNCTFFDGTVMDIEIEEYLYADWDLFLRNCTNVTLTEHSSMQRTRFTFLDCNNLNLSGNNITYDRIYVYLVDSWDAIISSNSRMYLTIEGGGRHRITDNNFSTSGPWITGSRDILLQNNQFYGNGYSSADLISCENLSLFDNEFEQYTLTIEGDYEEIESLRMERNTIDGKTASIIRDTDLTGKTYIGDLGYIILLNISGLKIGNEEDSTSIIGFQAWKCDDISIINTNMELGGSSLSLSECRGIIISHCTASSIRTELNIRTCEQIEMSNCTIESNYGYSNAYISRSDNIILQDNNMTGVWGGIRVSDSNHTLIKNNRIGSNYGGVYLQGVCLYNRILNNSINYGNIGLDLDGESLSALELGCENTIQGQPIMFIKGTYDPRILHESQIYQLIIFDLHDLDLRELSRFSLFFGLTIFHSSDLLFEDLNITSDYGLNGVSIHNSERIRISNSIFYRGGISIYRGNRNIVDGCMFDGGHIGIEVEYTTDIRIYNNTLIAVDYSIEITDTSRIEITGNELSGDYGGLVIKRSTDIVFHNNSGLMEQGRFDFQECENISFGGSILNGRYLGVEFFQCKTVKVFKNWMQDANGFLLINVENLIFIDNYISDTGGHPVELASVSGLYFNNNTILIGGRRGIVLGESCSDFIISDNTITNQRYQGILINSAFDGVIIGNDLTKNGNGIYIDWGSNILVTGNNIERNEVGIHLKRNSENITIWANTFDRNNDATEFRNLSRYQASDYGTNNSWFMEFGGGNMWSDWRGDDKDGDGFVDDWYPINGSAESYDEKPLVWELEGEEVNGGVLNLSSETWCFVMIIAFAALVFLIGKILREGSYDQDKKENM
ncbi:MAG: right-handed parallel beta-helix repeat-containing protein [Thermoplasmata archaeon]|nr:right-handed parallel beta-helix repeat-containing protein [Thermoplasmata archaeon]